MDKDDVIDDRDMFFTRIFPDTLQESLPLLAALPEIEATSEMYTRYRGFEIPYALIILNLLRDAGIRGVRMDKILHELVDHTVCKVELTQQVIKSRK